MYLLDANVISEPTKSKPRPSVLSWLQAQPASDLFVSVLTLGEIANGIESVDPGPKRERLVAWNSTLAGAAFAGRVLDVTYAVAAEWGRLEARHGRSLARLDALIAATARHHNLTVVTRNMRDFEHLPVRTVNPWLT